MKTESQLVSGFDNTTADTADLLNILFIRAEELKLTWLQHADSDVALWERLEAQTARIERLVFRIKMDAKRHAMDASPM